VVGFAYNDDDQAVKEEATMKNEERPLYEIVEALETAWNNSDSAAWAAQFAEDADFIHILGGHYQGRDDIDRGHRLIFDTIYKGSRNQMRVERIRFLGPNAAIVFILGNLTWYQNGTEQHTQARPTIIVEKQSDGCWQIVTLQNTLVTTGAPSSVIERLTQEHPFKGDAPVE
jgi:uncharacterized protein (TIGR02246 family)